MVMCIDAQLSGRRQSHGFNVVEGRMQIFQIIVGVYSSLLSLPSATRSSLGLRRQISVAKRLSPFNGTIDLNVATVRGQTPKREGLVTTT